jgi:hypothetical protein
MSADENEKIELNIPEKCPKCGKGAYYRMSPNDDWRCYFCDPPPLVKRMIEQKRNE